MGTDAKQDKTPKRPARIQELPVPPLPAIEIKDPDPATEFSHYRTGLSHHRTELSEHRTDLSEFRTDLSQHRTHLSEDRTEMSMRRTGMSLHRTRMSADRTLMSVLRTSLSLIGFGFTLYQTFEKLHEANVIHNAVAPRNFGLSMIVLGSLLLLGGIASHVRFIFGLRHTRHILIGEQLIHGESGFPVSVILITATALLAIGILSTISIVFGLSLFG